MAQAHEEFEAARLAAANAKAAELGWSSSWSVTLSGVPRAGVFHGLSAGLASKRPAQALTAAEVRATANGWRVTNDEPLRLLADVAVSKIDHTIDQADAWTCTFSMTSGGSAAVTVAAA